MTLKLGVPSKGRLMDKTFAWFARHGIELSRAGSDREYAGAVQGIDGVSLVLLSAGEIPRELAAGRIHLGVTGTDLVHERLPRWEQQVEEIEPLGFGRADLIIAVPNCWADVDNLDDLDAAAAGPLFCGGITVFNPILQCGVKPTDRVGVVGIGGLGHLAVQFLRAWGCEVTAFTSSDNKHDEAMRLGAHHVVNSRDDSVLKGLAGRFDFLLVTVNVSLNWPAYLATLAAHGRLHVVGAVLKPMAIPAFSLIGGAKSISGSPLGSPATLAKMLEFCGRHQIQPMVEHYAMADCNAAVERLRSGAARYRVVVSQEAAGRAD